MGTLFKSLSNEEMKRFIDKVTALAGEIAEEIKAIERRSALVKAFYDYFGFMPVDVRTDYKGGEAFALLGRDVVDRDNIQRYLLELARLVRMDVNYVYQVECSVAEYDGTDTGLSWFAESDEMYEETVRIYIIQRTNEFQYILRLSCSIPRDDC